jgi:polysaccharide deacetylase 2 family uncharacterized protein YibQ
MPTAGRNVFLDNDREESAIAGQLLKLAHHARAHGRAIGIGHPFPETANAIGRCREYLEKSGIVLVSVSKLLAG